MAQAGVDSEANPHPRGRSQEDYAEQWLFDHSPFNLWITTALVYAAFMALYGLATWINHLPWIVKDGAGYTLQGDARLALILPLIGCASLGLQRYSRLRELADAPNFERALRPGFDWYTPSPIGRLRRISLLGLVIGLGVIVLIAPWRQPGGGHREVIGWFTVASVFLTVLFLRGLVLTGSGARHARYVIETGLDIDLLRIERLYPWGRAAARTALVWFAVSAAALLLVADSGLTVYTVPLLVGCVGMGVWAFVGTLMMVHSRIRLAKAAELERLRDEIDAARTSLDADPTAPARLQSLLAYEKRIDDAPEWPFDQTILVRVGASALILAVPWFGQAVAQLVVENVSKVVH